MVTSVTIFRLNLVVSLTYYTLSLSFTLVIYLLFYLYLLCCTREFALLISKIHLFIIFIHIILNFTQSIVLNTFIARLKKIPFSRAIRKSSRRCLSTSIPQTYRAPSSSRKLDKAIKYAHMPRTSLKSQRRHIGVSIRRR